MRTPTPSYKVHPILDHLEFGWLVLDWHLGAGRALVLATKEVGDLLVLCLLDGGFVVLWALLEDMLLDGVDGY